MANRRGNKMRRPRKERRIKEQQPPQKVCPYCGAEVVCKNSSRVYGRSYGQIWICSRYPECDSYVGCHRGTNHALGRVANKELRSLKIQAHDAFDPLWRNGSQSRYMAYEWLATELGLSAKETHIGEFDEELCRRVIKLCERLNDEK